MPQRILSIIDEIIVQILDIIINIFIGVGSSFLKIFSNFLMYWINFKNLNIFLPFFIDSFMLEAILTPQIQSSLILIKLRVIFGETDALIMRPLVIKYYLLVEKSNNIEIRVFMATVIEVCEILYYRTYLVSALRRLHQDTYISELMKGGRKNLQNVKLIKVN